MAEIIIDSVQSKKYFKIDFGENSGEEGLMYSLFWAEDILTVSIDSETGFVLVLLKHGAGEWRFSYDNSPGSLGIDNVDGTEPTSNDHLAELIADLKGIVF